MKNNIIYDGQPKRIDTYLGEVYDDFTRSFVKKNIEKIRVNNDVVKPSYKLNKGDIIEVELEKIEFKLEPYKYNLDILYEDEHLAFINKPKGMVVHPGAANETDTLAAALLYHYGKDNLSSINGENRPGIIHRLDKDTSGVLVICKNNLVHSKLAKLIETHEFNRIYRGIVVGKILTSGIVDAPIGRCQSNRVKNAIVKNGRPAITYYKPLKDLDRYTYMEFKLETGRTHQIRVHMQSINRPLLGDFVYGKKSNLSKGQALHAYKLGFVHPMTDKYIEITSNIPSYMESIVN